MHRVVIRHSHSWILFVFIFFVYVTWATSLLVWIVDLRSYYVNLVKEVIPDVAQSASSSDADGYDPLGFGQVPLLLSYSRSISLTALLSALSCDLCPSTFIRHRQTRLETSFRVVGISESSPAILLGRPCLHIHWPT